ncbi:M48 family metallopeptidase [Pseudothauera rhizosphaerae]|uniref:M48 family metallopeptidase n=1 Tax=Pseudothauera rhizosphaerae TaxID=2565932 RepID=A0A4S4APX9_9RHOO|nr:M48 family metallopeptidase [Pseudothauera rhizosphaerae]
MLRRRTAPREEACETVLGGRRVRYTLRRSARRTLALQVDARGVKVAVPLHCPAAEVERFIATHTQWLLDKLDALAARPAVVPFKAVDGAEFPLLGRPCRLNLGGSGRAVRWRVAPDGIDELLLPVATVDTAAALERALRRRALAWYPGRVAEYCHRLGVPVPTVRLSSARTRWGSCSRHSGIRLHWRLIHLAPALVDYVVAHEVAHLAEMNHSPRFWSVVESLYPDWRAARRQLREAAATLPVIAAGDETAITEED